MHNLCSECQAIFDHWYERDNWSSARPQHLHHNIVGLQQSARKGCPVCVLQLRGLDDDMIQLLQQERPELKSVVTVALRNAALINYYNIKFLFNIKGDDVEGNEAEGDETEGDDIEGDDVEGDEFSKQFPHIEIEVYPSGGSDLKVGQIQHVVNCEENWALAKKWLRVCQDMHPTCSQNSIKRQLPTRLLDVGVRDSDLRLCLSKSLPRETLYLTLSHCWGGKVFTTLTRDNFQDFLARIPAENLSKTFKEAIVTTRKLGFRYLWIDSLCIIQGDEVDWQYEASVMGTVYANSALNIAAAAAPNGDTGLFSTRLPGKIFGCKVLARNERDSSHTSVWDCAIPDFIWELLNNNILNSRAWVFQELFLAPKSLYFTAHQLGWECKSSRACETFPDSFINNTARPEISTRYTWEDPTQNIADKWAVIVVGYSRGSVTFSRDKLVAISGVARLFATQFRTTYLAGMWKKDLVKQLAWFTTLESGVRTQVSTMPSWSWAAVNTPVTFPGPESLNPDSCIRLVSIIDATTVVLNDCFGQVKEGKIRVRCHVPCFGILTQQHSSNIFTIKSWSAGFILLIWPDTTPCSLKDGMYFMTLLQGTRWDGDPLLYGLVLKPAGSESYCRVGCFQTSGAKHIEEFMFVQKEASSADKHFIREPSAADEDGNEMCVITII